MMDKRKSICTYYETQLLQFSKHYDIRLDRIVITGELAKLINNFTPNPILPTLGTVRILDADGTLLNRFIDNQRNLTNGKIAVEFKDNKFLVTCNMFKITVEIPISCNSTGFVQTKTLNRISMMVCTH